MSENDGKLRIEGPLETHLEDSCNVPIAEPELHNPATNPNCVFAPRRECCGTAYNCHHLDDCLNSGTVEPWEKAVAEGVNAYYSDTGRDKGLAPLWALAERLYEEGDQHTARRAYPTGAALRHAANRIRNTLRFIEGP